MLVDFFRFSFFFGFWVFLVHPTVVSVLSAQVERFSGFLMGDISLLCYICINFLNLSQINHDYLDSPINVSTPNNKDFPYCQITAILLQCNI